MNEQDKLYDLCARLPYGVIVRHIKHKYNYKIDSYHPRAVFEFELSPISPMLYYHQECSCHIEDIKPYLRSMSRMTDEEIDDYHKTMDKYTHRIYPNSADFSKHTEYSWTAETIDWLNKHHFDYRGLIEKELALEAPEGTYK